MKQFCPQMLEDELQQRCNICVYLFNFALRKNSVINVIFLGVLMTAQKIEDWGVSIEIQ